MCSLAGKKQSEEHVRNRINSRLKNNPSYMPKGYVVWNRGKTKETDKRIALYAKKAIKYRKIVGKGYIGIYMPDHPMNSRGYVMEHRIKMEQKIGRYLYKHEDVHHINEDKKDNRIENLKLMTKSEHARFHAIKNGFGGNWRLVQ